MDLAQFSPNSRVWVYTSNRSFSSEEVLALNQQIESFTKGWTAHNQQLKATGTLLHSRLLVLVVDETQAGASGCSIDSSVHFIQELGKQYQCDFFTRELVGLPSNDLVRWVNFKEIPTLLADGQINGDTLMLDTLAKDLKELNRWEKPLSASWLNRYLKSSVS
ncbi:MAG: hypothetical protein LPK45_05885 [Bacteroidota bacterium]|nr:hypothetical protein [Bacteroidota bacterium]MDX5430597.1 hypothetical protein [Bacteroidota bacterium]MDX5469349.1 hypothetical protein [Bacteroidota bacterium]